MKPIFKNTVLLLFAVAVLASSTGVTLFKMVCGSSGKEVVSLNQIKNCCSEEEKECNSFEKKCCDFSAQTFKVSLLHKSEYQAICFELAPLPIRITVPTVVSLKVVKPSIFSAKSPPKTGRQILCFNSTYSI